MESITRQLEQSFIKKFGQELHDQLSHIVKTEIELMECIGQRRDELHLKQSDLAKAIGTTQAQISRYETMERSPSLHVFLKILYEMDLDIQLVDKEGHIVESKWK